MRDIRDDLRERLAIAEASLQATSNEFDAKRQALEIEYREKIARFDRERAALLALLDVENVRGGGNPEQTAVNLKKSGGFRLPLAEFFITAVHSSGALTKDELREKAESAGYFADGDSGGRTTHTTLMNLVGAKRLYRDDAGSYLPIKGRRLLLPALMGSHGDLLESFDEKGSGGFDA